MQLRRRPILHPLPEVAGTDPQALRALFREPLSTAVGTRFREFRQRGIDETPFDVPTGSDAAAALQAIPYRWHRMCGDVQTNALF